jgi:integrase
MTMTKKSQRIDSRTARSKLGKQTEPYWHKLAKGLFLGYRKNTNGGSWTCRYRDAEGKQNFKHLGDADDHADGEASLVLSFEQAQESARTWLRAMISSDGGAETYTVARCVEDYVKWLKLHRKSASHVDTYTKAYILPALGNLLVADLTAPVIRKWHVAISEQSPRLRTKRYESQKFRAEDEDKSEAQRKRRLRANRQLSILKAALNRGWQEGLVANNDSWRRVEAFSGTERPRSRHLTIDEARRLINACPEDLRKLVSLALLSGARFSELCRLRNKDFNPASSTLHIRDSKSGKPRHIILNGEGERLCNQLVAGRPDNDPMLRKSDGAAWRQDHQHRPFKAAIKTASIDPSFTFHELRHTWASLTIMNGAPLNVVAANLGHSDTRMVERHYGHLSESYKTEIIRSSAPVFGVDPASNIVRFSGQAS